MRFIELLTIAALVATVANAAPTQNKREVMELDQPLNKNDFVFDPTKSMREAARRKKLHGKRSDGCCNGKHNKRADPKDCCGGKFGLNLGGRLDLSAGTDTVPVPPAPAPAPPAPPAPPAVPAAPVNRNNDRNGDSVVVVVDAKHG